MRIISKKALREFWQQDSSARNRLKAWFNRVQDEEWSNPQEVLNTYPTASSVGDGRFVFRLGNDYRLVTYIAFDYYTVYIKWVGSHDEYDDIDVTEVDEY